MVCTSERTGKGEKGEGNQRAGRESSPAGGAAARVGHWTPLFLAKASDVLYHTLARGDPDLKTARVRAPGLLRQI